MNITSPRQLIRALPAIFGDIDDGTIAVVCLNDGLITSSIQLERQSSAVEHIEPYLQSLDRDADGIVVIGFDSQGQKDSEALQEIQRAAETERINVLDLLMVTGTRWRSILCTDEACCPQRGHEMEVSHEPTDFAEIQPEEEPKLAGEQQLLVRDLAPEELRVRDLAFEQVSSLPSGSPDSLFELRDRTVSNVIDLLTTASEDAWHMCATLCHAITDIRTRDGVLRRVLEMEDQREAIASNLVRAFRVAPAQYRAAIATVYAGTVWLSGNRPLTRHAVDVALDAESDYSLARLLDTALVHGVPHRVWVESLSAVAYEKCLVGAA